MLFEQIVNLDDLDKSLDKMQMTASMRGSRRIWCPSSMLYDLKDITVTP